MYISLHFQICHKCIKIHSLLIIQTRLQSDCLCIFYLSLRGIYNRKILGDKVHTKMQLIYDQSVSCEPIESVRIPLTNRAST